VNGPNVLAPRQWRRHHIIAGVDRATSGTRAASAVFPHDCWASDLNADGFLRVLRLQEAHPDPQFRRKSVLYQQLEQSTFSTAKGLGRVLLLNFEIPQPLGLSAPC